MKRVALTLAVLSLGLVDADQARADSPIALRVFRGSGPTTYSGAQQASYANESVVHINATMSDLNEADQIYALRGIEIQEDMFNDACGVRPVPGYLDPARSSSVRNDMRTFASSCQSGKKDATLPDGAFITSVQICSNGKSGAESRLKGVRIWGSKLDAAAHFTALADPVTMERPNCKTWENRVSCPAGTVATSLDVMATSSIQKLGLRCGTVIERSKTPPEYTITAGDVSWTGSKMNTPIMIEATGQQQFAYRGVTVRAKSSTGTCEQAFPNEIVNVLGPGSPKKTLALSVTCTREQATGGCDGKTTCPTTIEWTFNITAVGTTTGTPVTGSQVVSLPGLLMPQKATKGP